MNVNPAVDPAVAGAIVETAYAAASGAGSTAKHVGNSDVTAQLVAPDVVCVAVQQQPPSGFFGDLLRDVAGPDRPQLYFFTVRPHAFRGAARGYAPRHPAAPAPAGGQGGVPAPRWARTRSTSAAASASSAEESASTNAVQTVTQKTTTSKDLAFLDSKTMSIEDKIMAFMAYVQKKTNAELIEKMKGYQAKKQAEKQAAQAKKDDGGGGLFGVIGDLVGGAVDLVSSAAKTLGGPLLAAGASVLAPPLVPLALKYGGALAGAAVDGIAGELGVGSAGSRASSGSRSATAESAAASGSAASASGDSEEVDDQLMMLQLQQLMQKQERMFAAMSNALKSIHDGQMVAIHNIK